VAGLIGSVIECQGFRSICGLPVLIEDNIKNPTQPAFKDFLVNAAQLDFIECIAAANGCFAFTVMS